MKQHRTQIIIAGTVFILVILILINASLTKKKAPAPTTTGQSVNNNSFKSIANAPTLPPSRGQGVDVESETVQNSKSEIEKIKKSLPYIKTITVNGEQVTIRIPEASLQDYSWSLLVYLPDFDFQAPTETPFYLTSKNTFRAAAAEVYKWIRSQGADPQKIIIKWGDTAFMQERAQEWLK